MMNGKSMVNVKPSRGIRQGEPLSPYMFILIVDVLPRSLLKAANSGYVRGITFNSFFPILTHLLFANDSLFFVEDEEFSVHRLRIFYLTIIWLQVKK